MEIDQQDVFPNFNECFVMDQRQFYPVGGLTKRELFAAFALNGLLSGQGMKCESDYKAATTVAVLYADKLIQELNVKEQSK